MKSILPILALVLLPLLANAQYEVGVPVYDTLYSGTYNRITDCYPIDDVKVGVDDPLINFVNGLELTLILTEINIPNGALSNGVDPLFTNDSLVIDENNSFHPFYFGADGYFKFNLIAKGVPLLEKESYPCILSSFISTVVCAAGYVITPEFGVEECEVQPGVVVQTEQPKDQALQINLSPNPTSGQIIIDNKMGRPIAGVRVYNMSGQLVLDRGNQLILDRGVIDLSEHPPGIYGLWLGSDLEGVFKKVIKR